ncbi:Hypothetical predicted protein [Xyrichtys novacula]|uniref:Uncharacterized protein n=1 Tax=Xyrichtys novacula TaxID=13765 RepID=A0AAV1F084_XYRNO|nr:Hypothetical predicted protein [Xyrichtys novacula]
MEILFSVWKKYHKRKIPHEEKINCIPQVNESTGARSRSECVYVEGWGSSGKVSGLICPICDTLTYCPGKGTPGPDQPALGLSSSNVLQTLEAARPSRGRERGPKMPHQHIQCLAALQLLQTLLLRLFSQESDLEERCPLQLLGGGQYPSHSEDRSTGSHELKGLTITENIPTAALAAIVNSLVVERLGGTPDLGHCWSPTGLKTNNRLQAKGPQVHRVLQPGLQQ